MIQRDRLDFKRAMSYQNAETPDTISDPMQKKNKTPKQTPKQAQIQKQKQGMDRTNGKYQMESVRFSNEMIDNRTSQTSRKQKNTDSQEEFISQKRLQEAVIWSEILGKPLCKRRNRASRNN